MRILYITATVLLSASCGGLQDASAGDPQGVGGPGEPGVPDSAPAIVAECAEPEPGWIWCDDFEVDRLDRYFEYSDRDGSFTREAGVGVDGSYGMRVRFVRGQVDAGALRLAFGATPQAYLRPVDDGTARYREIYWRVYLKNASDWTGGGADKLSRATILASDDWAQAMVAHLWSGGGGRGGDGSHYLVLDPAFGTDAEGRVRTTKYNDFDNLRWLGAKAGRTPLFDDDHIGRWYCIEAHLRLNDPGRSNGLFEYWIDDELEARIDELDWVGTYDAYGINAVFFENYWNAGSPRAQERYFDNIVVSTERIGCDTVD